MHSSIIKCFFSGNKRSVIVKKNIIGSLFIKGCSILVSLMLVPMTLGYVSSELYGIWLTLSSIMVWVGFFDVGFTLGLKNKLAEAIALGDWQRGKVLVSTTYFMMTLIFIPLCLLLEFAVPIINWASFLNINPVYNEEIIQTLHILVACFSVQMIVQVLTAVISAYQEVALSSAFPVIGNCLSLIAIFALTKLYPPSLTALALAISIMPILVLLVASVVLFHKRFKAISPELKSINVKYVKDLFGLGAKFFIIQIQALVLYQCTNILISNMSGPNEVTTYNITYKYLSVAMMIFTIILGPLWPAFTDAYTKKDFGWMRNVYKKMIGVYLVSASILIVMIACSSFVYHIWIGNKAMIPFTMTLIVGLYMIVNTWDTLQVQLINGIGAIKLQTVVTLIGLVLYIPLSLFLGKYLGAIGVVLSMTLITAVYAFFFTIQINKILRQKAAGIWIN